MHKVVLQRSACVLAIGLGVGGLLPTPAAADPITFGPFFAFRDNEGPNTIGTNVTAAPDGLNISVVAENVSPNAGTVGSASQGATTHRLINLFAGFGHSNSRSFATDIQFSESLTGPWTIVLQNGTDSATATTNSLAGVAKVERPVLSAVTAGLTPTITWTNPSAGTFTRNLIQVWDDTTNTLIATLSCFPFTNTCTSRTIPTGLLAPNGQYTVRILAENRSDPAVFATTTSRSNASVNFNAISTARENGTVRTLDSTLGDTGAAIVAGANSFPNMSVHAGGGAGSRGAITVDSASSLVTSFLNAGFQTGSFGNLLVNGGSVHLDGTSAFSAGGGFMTVGQFGTGYASFISGASVVLEADGFNSPGFTVGRMPGAFGHINVVGAGTTITVDGSTVGSAVPIENGLIRVGAEGSGRLDILGGAVVSNAPNGLTDVGAFLGGRGAVNVGGPGSRLNAGAVLNVGGGGEGVVSARNGGEVAATNIYLNNGGGLTGDGTYIGAVTLRSGGFISPGLSPGLMVVDGDLILDGGIFLMEAFGPSDQDEIRVTGNAVFGAGLIRVLLGFTPDPGFVFDFFDVLGTTTILSNFGGIEAIALVGSGAAGSEIMVRVGDTVFAATAVGVPEPGTLSLLAVVLAGLWWRRLCGRGLGSRSAMG
jgi:T5SS/PEP-CTERM-associated repeat protein